MRVFIVDPQDADYSVHGIIHRMAREANIDVAVYLVDITAIEFNFSEGYVSPGDKFFVRDPTNNAIVKIAQLSQFYKIPIRLHYEVETIFATLNKEGVNRSKHEEVEAGTL